MVEENQEKKIKTLQEDVSMLESYVQDLFAFTPLPLCFVNPKGMVLEVNPAFIKATGYDEYDIVGESLFKIMEEKDVREILRQATEEKVVEEQETVIKTKEEKEIPATVFVKSRKIKGEGVNGIFFSFFNLTDIKRKEEEIKKRKEELEEKVEEMEKINRLTIGREVKMAELKDKIKRLKEEIREHKKKQNE